MSTYPAATEPDSLRENQTEMLPDERHIDVYYNDPVIDLLYKGRKWFGQYREVERLETDKTFLIIIIIIIFI